MVCYNCANELSSNFCAHCGAPAQQRVAPLQQMPKKGLAFASFLCGLTAYILYNVFLGANMATARLILGFLFAILGSIFGFVGWKKAKGNSMAVGAAAIGIFASVLVLLSQAYLMYRAFTT